MEARYRSTLWACCFANFFQAVGSCFAILYVPLRGLYGLSFTDFGILVSLNFITQVASDVLFSKPVEKYGFRPFAVAAPLVSAAGLGLFAAAPILFPQRPFAGFCAGMFLFAAAGGLQELLLSPILDALPIPEERKARSMSMLHSFFAWGQIFVVLATTGLLAVWGAARWQWIVLLWAAPPVAGAALFCRVPLARKNGGAPPLPLRALARKGVFYALLAAIVLGGAAEVTMAQWASAFLEKGLQLPKLAGDVWGVCFFSLMLALGRSGYAALGARVPLHRLLIGGSGAAAVLYVVCALAQSPLLGVLACGLTGLCVSLLWPGAIILASRRIPSAGRPCSRCFPRAAMWARPWGRSAWAARRTGRRRPARCLRGPRGNLGRCARACCWRRCSRCCAAACTRRFIAAKRGPAYPQGANGGTGNRRKLFFKPEPPFADGAKDRKMNKRRGLHGRAVFVPGGQPQSGERDAVAGSANWNLLSCTIGVFYICNPVF